MFYKVIKPPASLAKWVKSFWIVEGETIRTTPMLYRLMADPCPEIVFQYRNQFSNYESGKTGETDPISSITGQNNLYRELMVTGKYGLIGVCIYPFTVQKLLGIPAKEITNQVFDIYTLLGNEGKYLEEKVIEQKTNQERIQIISQFLKLRLQNANDSSNDAINYITRQIFLSGGQASIGEIAQETNLSFRQFERNFASSTGLTPKVFSRIVRFQSSIKKASAYSFPNLTSLAYASGYSDQSHFIREFKSFSGINPKTYFNLTDEVADTFFSYGSSAV